MSGVLCIISAVALAAILATAMWLLSKRGIPLQRWRQILAVTLVVATFIRYLTEKVAVYYVRGLNMYSPFGDETVKTIIAILLIWFTYAAIVSVIMDQFFDFPTLRSITRFFAAPVFILDLAFFEIYAIGIIGTNAFEVFDSRILLIPLEIALGLGLIAGRLLSEPIVLPTKRVVGRLLYSLPFAILAIIPPYVPQALIGFVDESIKIYDLTEEHRVVLYFSIIIPFLIFHALKNESFEVKRFAMIYMSFSMMWSYLATFTFEILSYPWCWPIHVCNTAMFLIPLCLTFRWNKLFYFTLFVNVLGAFLANVMPNTDEGINALGTTRVHYWINHYPAFFMPVLLVALKLFARPKFREFVYSLIAFSCYFIMVLVLNAWFTNYDAGVDFFFLNSDFIADKLGKWAEDLRNVTLEFTVNGLNFKFYPLYQFLYYLGFIAMSAGMWFLYAILFTSWDDAEDRRLRERDYKKMKKELIKFLDGKSIHEPVCGDSSPHLVLKHFSKKYGRNKHYSVENASFEVRGGEIFGFLGPNGAGKSTIIKSVVGIQTITEGNIEICGFDVDKQSVQAKKELGFVPDHYALYENLTGREYINYIADLYEVNYEYRNATIEKYVELFQLTGSFDNQMKTYSHGMKQKITIMAALVHNPKVWILDEPLTGLDPTSIHEVKECMKDHAAKGNIVFFSSHIIDVVEKICDKIAIIKKGKLRAVAKVSELDARGIDLEQFYLDIIYGDDSDTSVKLIGVTADEAGIYPDDDAKPEPAGEVVAAQ